MIRGAILGGATLCVLAFLARTAASQAIGLPMLSEQSQLCIECHKELNRVIYQQWGESKHYRGNVGCFECHSAEEADADAMEHNGFTISVIVSPRDCARCHSREVAEFTASRHSLGGRILGSLDNFLAEIVEGNGGMKTIGFPEGISAAAVSGCLQCHGSQVKVLADGTLDQATYPNSGIGRLNPDGSEGSCNACHTRHAFSAAQARHPATCGKCHLGPDHPQKEIYEESKHGIAFFTNAARMNLDSEKWIVGEDYWAAPTCATCHMSATADRPVTHNIGMRISWNNRPEISVRPEVADAKMDIPGKDVPWQVRRENMKNVCLNCHNENWVNGFYAQYDALVDLYNEKFGKPGMELYAIAAKLKPIEYAFSHEIDWIWFELWHHEGRRARHGAAMMAPDFTHWLGTYDVAKRFYSEFIPKLQEMAESNLESPDADKRAIAAELASKIEKVLASPDHRWFIGKLDPEEEARRRKEREEFRQRYSK